MIVVPVDDAAAARPPPPAKAAGATAVVIVIGATTHEPQRRFFRNSCQHTWDVLAMTYLCLWTRPNVYKAALSTIVVKYNRVYPKTVR